MCADYYRHFSVAVRLHGKLAPAWVSDTLRSRRKKRLELTDAGDDDAADEIAIDFEWIVEDGCLYLSDDGASGNVEHVAALLRELIRLGYVEEPVAVQFADSCSRPRPDSFSGGALIVTKRKTYAILVPDLVEKKIDALERRRRASR